MPKNIVVCCDGTGNEFRESRRNTNVVKLFEVVVKDPARQIAYYDPGVGTLSVPGFVTFMGKWLSIGMGLAIAFDFLFRMVRSRMIDVTGKTVDVVLAANIFEHVMAVKMAPMVPVMQSQGLRMLQAASTAPITCMGTVPF